MQCAAALTRLFPLLHRGTWRFACTLVTPLGVQQILHTVNGKTTRNKDEKRALKCTQLASLHGCLLCTEHCVSFHHGKRTTKVSHTQFVVSLGELQRQRTAQERCSHLRGKECFRSVSFFFRWCFLCTEHPSFLPMGMHSTKGTHTKLPSSDQFFLGGVLPRDVPLAKNPSTGTAQQRLF